MRHFAEICMYVMGGVFVLGLAGSAVVVAITFVEDVRDFFGKEEIPEPGPHAPRT